MRLRLSILVPALLAVALVVGGATGGKTTQTESDRNHINYTKTLVAFFAT